MLLISDAEKLYQDEYFEQCIAQSRRYAESLCKNVLGDKRTSERTFDDMLATLKDNAIHSKQEKEFIDDLYFLKREGNNSVHSSKVQKDGMVALECLQRAFELAISYVVYHKKGDNLLLKKRYDVELLVTGKASKESLKEKYETAKKISKKSSSNKKTKKIKSVKPSSSKKASIVFNTVLKLSFFISATIALTIYLLTLI